MILETIEEKNAGVVRRLFLDGFSRNDADVLREVLAEDFKLSSAGAIADDGLDAAAGRETLIAGMRRNHACLEGWGFTIGRIVADADHVAALWEATGRHVGSYMGETPSGRKVTLHGLSLFLMRDGRIAQDWVFADQAGFRAQMEAGRLAGAGETLVRRFWDEVINAHDPEAARALMASDYRQHADGIAHGPDGFIAFFREVLGDSMGMKADVLHVIEADDLVISSTEIAFESPPPGWRASQVIVDVFRTNATHLLEHWDMAAARATSTAADPPAAADV